MGAKRITVLAAAVALAMALSGCSWLSEEPSAEHDEGSLAYAYGFTRLPAAQGVIDFSPSRAVEVLANFEYREHDGEGQWANTASMFDMVDSGSPATLDAESSAGEGGWILTLSAYEDGEWRTCTLKDLEAGRDPERAEIAVYPRKGVSFADAHEAAELFTEIFSGKIGAIAFDADGEYGRLVFGVARNVSGAVSQIVQDDPGAFRLLLYTKSDWPDGSYDGLKAECKNQAEADGCEYHDFHVEVPLFEDQKLVLE